MAFAKNVGGKLSMNMSQASRDNTNRMTRLFASIVGSDVSGRGAGQDENIG